MNEIEQLVNKVTGVRTLDGMAIFDSEGPINSILKISKMKQELIDIIFEDLKDLHMDEQLNTDFINSRIHDFIETSYGIEYV